MKTARKRGRRAAALPMVLLLVSLNLILLVALAFYATNELRAGGNAVRAEAARALAQAGLDFAAGLVSAGSTNNAFVTYQRVTNVGGAWRLETRIANTAPADPSKPWMRRATNPLVLHSGFAEPGGGVDLNFGVRGDPGSGFIAPRSNAPGWTNLSADMFRMNWIYVYRGPADNPENLVGRFAFWVDDESTKLNINYSGSTNVYNAAFNNSQALAISLRGPRPGLAAGHSTAGDFNGRIWPLDMELGGIAGLSRTNVVDILRWRGEPGTPGFRSFPSVLGVRLGTIGQPGGPAVTNLSQQSALGFTATAYSREEERSYHSGRRRYDLMNLHSGASAADVINGFRAALAGEFPEFEQKYDLGAFASAAYSAVQLPGSATNTADSSHPASTFGSGRLYTRGLPLANEARLAVSVGNQDGTNRVEVAAYVELIQIAEARNLFGNYTQERTNSWVPKIAAATNFTAELEAPGGFFATNLPAVALAGPALTNSTNWFVFTNNRFAPQSTNFQGALGILRTNFVLAQTNGPVAFQMPSSLRLRLSYRGKAYQDIEIPLDIAPASANGTLSPAPGQTNAVFDAVGIPRTDGGYRGDPRPGVFRSQADAGVFAANHTNALASPMALNPGFDLAGYSGAGGSPDLTPPDIFVGQDYGLPVFLNNMANGFGPRIKGAGWVGELPVVFPAGAPEYLAWSTPRLWGDGRSSVPHGEFPPDWLMLDAFHMAMFPAGPAGDFWSYGRLNINGAKPFFQVSTGSTNRAETVVDSVVMMSETKDFDSQTGQSRIQATSTARTNLLVRIAELTRSRNDADNPYPTPFEFLAELAATNWSGSPGWWYGPGAAGQNATSTTDRRAEGVVRSLNQKITTHGNQFTIFSLGQALEVTPSGRTNVTGEVYLQGVFERAPLYDESTGAITNSPTGAPPMRQLYLRELRH